MAQKILKGFIPVVLISIFFFSTTSKACGYYEGVWEYRTMLFQAQLPGWRSLAPFTYTLESSYFTMDSDFEKDDRKRNVEAWRKATAPNISDEDIYAVQYNVEPNEFIASYDASDWGDLEKNTFIKYLITPSNKEQLDYMYFAKQVENSEYEVANNNNFYDWDGIRASGTDILNGKIKLYNEALASFKKVKSAFLKERYAFQIIRLGWQCGYHQQAVDTYLQYFKKPDRGNIINSWACLFVAMAYDRLDKKKDANRFYIHTFAGSNEKRLRAIQLYNRKEPMGDAGSAYEQSMDNVLKAMNYPGRSLDNLENAYSLDKHCEFMPFLIKREINKLEDWLLSSLYMQSIDVPTRCKKYEGYVEEYRQNDLNLETDMKYLAKLKLFAKKLYETTPRQDHKDYYALVYAHLALLDEKPDEGKMYLDKISNKANESIKYQKSIEKLWLSIHTDDISSSKFKQMFIAEFKEFEKNFPNDIPNFIGGRQPRTKEFLNRLYYTMNLALAYKYKEKGDVVHYVLLKNKSDINCVHAGMDDDSYIASQYWSYGSLYYQRIKHLDYWASPTDIDQYIALMEKGDKDEFDNYLCDQFFLPTDAYRDLKGTIAFRNKDFKLAYEAFASMDQDYWRKNYEFSNYLNEDPFIPKALYPEEERDFGYDFNKTQFLKELLALEMQSKATDKNVAAEAYLKLAHTFYNTSFFGNSWMMSKYGQSFSENYYLENMSCLPDWLKDYYSLNTTIRYYEKAFALSTDGNKKAYASLMLSNIYSLRFSADEYRKGLASDSINAAKYARIYYNDYQNTAFAKQNECFGYLSFIN